MPQYCGDFAEVLHVFQVRGADLNVERIIEYALKLDAAMAKRLGWVLERQGVELATLERQRALRQLESKRTDAWKAFDEAAREVERQQDALLDEISRRLNAPAAAKVAAALYQLAAGNRSNVKGVGTGVFERKIDFGPGYRIYFGKDGDSVVILLGGSTKQRQQQAIETAKERWTAYRRRKGT